jgi:hypothetical protein
VFAGTIHHAEQLSSKNALERRGRGEELDELDEPD